MNSKLIALLLAVALASAGLTYSVVKKSSGASPSGTEQADSHGEDSSESVKIAGLELARAEACEGWDVVSLTGKVTVPPDRLVKISPRIEGKLVAAYGTLGDYVRKGQTLAVISSIELAEARARCRQASAKLAAARKNYERELQIVNLGGVSMRPLEEARAEKLASQGEVADAKSDLAQSKSEQTRAESELAQCKARLARAKELYADEIVSKQDLESAEAEYKRDQASVEAAESKVTQAQSRVEKALSKLEISGQYLAREERVYKSKALDTRALQTAKAEVAAAKVEVQSASDAIRVLGASPSGSGDTLAVKSPMAGRIVSRHFNVGEMAVPSDALFTVADLSQVWVEADVYERDLSQVRKGQTAEVHVDSSPNRVFTGKIESISDILSPESRTAKVRCVVDNSEGLLRGEMFAKVSLITARRGTSVLIPKQAVLDDGGKKIVFTVCRECAEPDYEKTEVTTGPAHGEKIEVLSGLEPGTEVVTVGAYQLKTSLGTAKLKAGCTDAGCED